MTSPRLHGIPSTRRRGSAAGWGLLAAGALMVTAIGLPAATGWDVHVRSFPPLHAEWHPRVGVGTLPELLLAVLSVRHAQVLAERLAWRPLLGVVFLGGVAWMSVLAFVDGTDGIGHILGTRYEYLPTARRTDDLPAMIDGYVERIPFDAQPSNWPVHIAGHPPGAVAFFVLLVRLGLGSGFAAGLVVTLLAATTAVAVLVTVRALGAEALARRAAPFLVLGPAAIWQAVSADAMFAAVAAWGLAALALSAVRRSLPLALVAGLLLGSCVMLSYGLPLLGVLALAVLWLGRSWLPLPLAVLGALGVVGAFHVLGFSYLEALPVIRERYFDGVGGSRPAAYWTWAGPAALLFATGPLLGAGLGHLAACWRSCAADGSARIVAGLSAAAVLTVLLADASQMSRAEVERIWLPFVPWLLLSCALLPERWRRPGLALQVGFALVVQHVLLTGW